MDADGVEQWRAKMLSKGIGRPTGLAPHALWVLVRWIALEQMRPAVHPAGFVCPVDGRLLNLLDAITAICYRCGRTWTAGGHLDFDFEWDYVEGSGGEFR